MQMSDSQRIPASKEKVWAALNDPAILKQCIPGCEALEMSSPIEMTATVVFRVGPVKATFGGKVTLSDLDPPNSYRISGEGSGGVAGFAKGGATVQAQRRWSGRDRAVLRGRRPDRRQARATGFAADRFHRQEARRAVLCVRSARWWEARSRPPRCANCPRLRFGYAGRKTTIGEKRDGRAGFF